MSRFVRPGGLFLFTCISAVSYQSEIFRRLVPTALGMNHGDVESVHRALFDFYDRSLRSLRFATRATRDWILDNITQDLEHRALLDIREAFSALGGDFSYFGSSPSLGLRRHWYKAYAGDPDLAARELEDAVWLKTLELLDHQVTDLHLDKAKSMELAALCDQNWDLMCQLQRGVDRWAQLLANVTRLASLVEHLAPTTHGALAAFASFLQTRELETLTNSVEFMGWWGRGQQYVIARKRED